MFLVTGSTGFVGRALVLEIQNRGDKVKVITRHNQKPEDPYTCYLRSIDGSTDWSEAMKNVDTVIHCAARAHRMNDANDSFEKYQTINTDGTLQLARACLKHRVRRLVFISTIKVCADSTGPGETVSPDSPLNPTDWYSKTKADAEIELGRLFKSTTSELVIVRPPLVYGPGAKGNLERLTKLISRQLPLPFGSINNKRSLVGLENLVDFLILVSQHPKANGQIFNVSDGETVSTPETITIIGNALDKRVILVPVPTSILKLLFKLTGKSTLINRLTANLEVDSDNCFKLLDWKPPLSVDESIESLVK